MTDENRTPTDDEPVWNILTRTHGGTVSLLKNLTRPQARQVMQRVRCRFDNGDPWSDWAIKRWLNPPTSPTGFYTVSDSDIEQVECWGPEGASMFEIWPRPADYDERYAKIAAETAARDATPR